MKNNQLIPGEPLREGVDLIADKKTQDNKVLNHEEVDNYTRMKLAIKEVKKLCSLDKNGRKEFLKNTLDIVLHNYQILVEDNSNRIAETFRKI